MGIIRTMGIMGITKSPQIIIPITPIIPIIPIILTVAYRPGYKNVTRAAKVGWIKRLKNLKRLTKQT